MNIVELLITLLVMAISFVIISKIPIGVDVDSFPKALTAAVVFGILNALLKPVLNILALPFNFLTFGLFSLVVNAIIFGLAALLVEGFRLRFGFWSALLGALALSLVSSLLSNVLANLGFATTY